MTTEEQTTSTSTAPDPTQVRWLHPDTCKVHLGTHGALHVSICDERIYGGVYAAYAFPVGQASKYISLLHSAGSGTEDVEIGIIRDLNEFPPEQADLVRKALTSRYFLHTISAIHKVGWKYGFIAMDVDTDKGPVSFLMRWQSDRAVDYGRRGKMLIDVNNNRYVIPDLDKLPAGERADFTRVIYW